MHTRARVRAEHGFTLIEVMVAAFVLLVGVLGTIVMIDRANAATSSTKAREGATGLARELVEDARALPYHELGFGQVTPRLQARPGLGDTTPATPGDWTIERRGITYRVTATACAVDDPKDRTGPRAVGTWCGGLPPAGTLDRDAQDYIRLTVTLAWIREGSQRTLTQRSLVVNPGVRAGVRVTALDPTGLSLSATGAVTSTASPIAFSVGTSRDASRVRWSVDGQQRGQASGANSSWQFDWPITDLPDGTYVIGAQGFDAFSRSAGARPRTIVLNRWAPAAPAGLSITSPSTGEVDLRWEESREQDVLGYTVYRVVAGVATPVPGCQRIAVAECIDVSPVGSSATYRVVAVDRDPVTGAPRDGAPVSAPAPPAGSGGPVNGNRPPSPPAGLEVTDARNSTVTLGWQSASDPDGDAIAYYRVYRNGSYLGRTRSGTDRSYTDRTREAFAYVVTAVDARGAESEPSEPAWPPGYTP